MVRALGTVGFIWCLVIRWRKWRDRAECAGPQVWIMAELQAASKLARVRTIHPLTKA